jgi:hypothetical protein
MKSSPDFCVASGLQQRMEVVMVLKLRTVLLVSMKMESNYKND